MNAPVDAARVAAAGRPIAAAGDVAPVMPAVEATPDTGIQPDLIAAAAAGDGFDSGGIVVAPSIPGAYLSPSAVFPPAAASSPHGVPVSVTAAAATSATSSAPAEPRPGEAALMADLPFDAPNTLSGWLVVIGSGAAAISFLLPWAPGIASYSSSWGLASIANIPVLALVIATAALAILPNGVAAWLRSGVLGMTGGALFLGILWPYVVGDFGAEFGSIVGAVAAVVLVAGGILAVVPRKEPAGSG